MSSPSMASQFDLLREKRQELNLPEPAEASIQAPLACPRCGDWCGPGWRFPWRGGIGVFESLDGELGDRGPRHRGSGGEVV